MSDPINPSHYKSRDIECIDVAETMNFNLGNALKYLWRAGLKDKDMSHDLCKAKWYIERELSRIEKGGSA